MAEGTIYDMFREEAHVRKLDQFDWHRFAVAIDHGTQNATTFGLYGIADLRNKHIMDELGVTNPLFQGQAYYHLIKSFYHSGRDAGIQKADTQYADDLEEFTEGWRRKLEYVIVDPEAAPFIAELRNRDMYNVVKAKKDVTAGIMTMSKWLNANAFSVDPGNTYDVKEFFSYVWDPKALDKGKEVPLKQNDHCMDRNRYMVYTDSLLNGNLESITGRKARG